MVKFVVMAFLSKPYFTLKNCLVLCLLQWKVCVLTELDLDSFIVRLCGSEESPKFGALRLSFKSQFFHFLGDGKQTTYPGWVSLFFTWKICVVYIFLPVFLRSWCKITVQMKALCKYRDLVFFIKISQGTSFCILQKHNCRQSKIRVWFVFPFPHCKCRINVC